MTKLQICELFHMPLTNLSGIAILLVQLRLKYMLPDPMTECVTDIYKLFYMLLSANLSGIAILNCRFLC